MVVVQDVRKQLLAIMDRYKLELASAGRDYSRICKAIASGYFFHAARKDAQEGFKTIVRSLCATPYNAECRPSGQSCILVEFRWYAVHT